MLHVTNGDSAADAIRRTGLAAEIVPWRDVLHEGPVPPGLTLEGMAEVRARFLASARLGSLPEILATFHQRNAALRHARHVVLWFEHDLYDQLQLIEILATLATQPAMHAELICIGAFPGVAPFYGLGQLAPAQLASLWPQRAAVSRRQLALGARAWQAFTSDHPAALQEFLEADLDALPFLRAAFERLGDEAPSPPTGLGRTERQILGAVAAGARTFAEVFRANQQQEPAPFMGDTTLRARIAALTRARTPLLTDEPYALTAAGECVRTGEADARVLNGLHRWIGGVHFVD